MIRGMILETTGGITIADQVQFVEGATEKARL